VSQAHRFDRRKGPEGFSAEFSIYILDVPAMRGYDDTSSSTRQLLSGLAVTDSQVTLIFYLANLKVQFSTS